MARETPRVYTKDQSGADKGLPPLRFLGIKHLVTREFISRNVKPRPVRVKVWKSSDLDTSKVSLLWYATRAGLRQWRSSQVAGLTAGQVLRSGFTSAVEAPHGTGLRRQCARSLFTHFFRRRCLLVAKQKPIHVGKYRPSKEACDMK